MQVLLRIDTTNNKEVLVSLQIDGKETINKQSLDTKKAQIVLPMIEELLDEKKIELKDLTAIKVNQGPGSFTGIRVGLSVANTLGFLLKIPVNDGKIGEPATATY